MDAATLAAAALAAALAVAFALAVAGKLTSPDSWRLLVAKVAGDRRGARTRRAMAVGLPVAEGLTAAALVVWPALGLAAAAALLAALGAGVLLVKDRLAGEGCGCFGALAESRIGAGLAVRNFAAAAVAGAGAGLVRSAGGPIDPVGLAIGAGAAGAVVLALKLRAVRAAGGPRIGSRVTVPGLVEGRPTVIAFVAASCPPCQRLAPTLLELTSAHPGVNLVAAVAPLGGSGAPEGLDRIEVPGLWDRLAKRMRVPATPYLVATGEDGRVVWHGPGNSDRARELVDRLDAGRRGDHPGPLGWPTRRRVLGLAFGAALAAAGGSALAAQPRRLPRIRRSNQAVPGLTFGDNPRNDFTGTCDAYRLRSRRGVVDSSGRQQEQVVGFTLAEGFDVEASCAPPPADKRLPLAAVVGTRRVSQTGRGRCTCPTLVEYDDVAECRAKCQSTLQCFGIQCEILAGEVCIEVLYSIKATRRPSITIDTLTWTPPAGASNRCKVYANSYNTFVRSHEERHARDTLDAISEFEKEESGKYKKVCAPTELAAQVELDRQIAQDVDSSYARLVTIDCAKNRNFHSSADGRGALPNCDLCR